jgi:tetratricopeptide (TPR) repeat protein
MDKYAGLLKGQSDIVGLSNLVTFMAQTKKNCPETWLVSARYLEAKGQMAKAIACTDKACSLDGTHQEAHYLKGALINKSGNSYESLTHLKKAHAIYPDMFTFEAIIHSYLTMEKSREAITVSKEMANVLSGHARCLAIVGMTFYQSGEHSKAKSAFQKSLARDPNCLDAAIGVATVLAGENNFDAAIEQ